jgi:Tfp pilus assembly protein PilF
LAAQIDGIAGLWLDCERVGLGPVAHRQSDADEREKLMADLDLSLSKIERIADQCEAGETAAAYSLSAADFADTATWRLLRTRIIPALRSAGDQAGVVHALILWISEYPDRTSDAMMLAGYYGRLGRQAEAEALLAELSAQNPEDSGIAAMAIQAKLRADKHDEAADIAEGFAYWMDVPPRAAMLGVLALNRAGRPERAIALGKCCDDPNAADVQAGMAEAYLAMGDPIMAGRVAQRALANGTDNAALRLQLAHAAKAQFQSGKAVVHLTAALQAEPKNLRALIDLGEWMLVKRRPAAARSYLEQAVALAPQGSHVRALLARACKDSRDYAAAAEQYLAILAMEPDHIAYRRQAAGVLKMAGREAEADALLRSMLAERQQRLPDDLAAGLDALWDNVDQVAIPKARLDWAWSLRDAARYTDRDDWERRTKWGFLADRLLQDWLESSSERAEEAMAHLADLGDAIAVLEPAAAEGPLILAGAHIGPLFAGPLAMQLMEFDSKWLASTPSYHGMAYNDGLISTSDQSEAQVVRKTMAALEQNISIVIAVDGAMSMAAPRVDFLGQQVTYSSFAARLAHHRGAQSFFSAPQWRDGHLDFEVIALPRAEAGETLEAFSERWRSAWFAELERSLRGEPENLRLSGGIWRHIQPIPRSAESR